MADGVTHRPEAEASQQPDLDGTPSAGRSGLPPPPLPPPPPPPWAAQSSPPVPGSPFPVYSNPPPPPPFAPVLPQAAAVSPVSVDPSSPTAAVGFPGSPPVSTPPAFSAPHVSAAAHSMTAGRPGSSAPRTQPTPVAPNPSNPRPPFRTSHEEATLAIDELRRLTFEDEQPFVRTCVRSAIAEIEGREPTDIEVLALEPEFLSHLRGMVDLLSSPQEPGAEVDELILAHRRVASLVEELMAIDYAELYREAAIKAIADSWHGDVERLERWSFWYQHDGDLIRPAADLLWLVWQARVQPRIKHPALSRAVVESIGSAFWKPGRVIQDVEGARVVRAPGRQGRTVAVVLPMEVSGEIPRTLGRSLGATSNILGHRLFRFLVTTVAIQVATPSTRDYRTITVRGGFKGLAQLLGQHGSKAADSLHAALDVMAHCHIVAPHGEVSGLLLYSTAVASPGRPALLRIVVGDVLLPDYVVRLPKRSRREMQARKLVPIPRLIPPPVGHLSRHAAQATLQMLVMVELRDHAEELVARESVRVPMERWRELAEESDLPLSMLPDVIARWLRDDDEGPAFLRRGNQGADFYTLGAAHAAELEVLKEGGRRAAAGRVDQARSRPARFRARQRRPRPG